MRVVFLMFLFMIESSFTRGNSLNDMFTAAEHKYRLPRGILSAIAQVESNTDVNAVVYKDGRTKRTSYSLLQLQLASARQMGFKGKPRELMNPRINIEYGAKYLRWLLDRQRGDTALALTAFNVGPSSDIVKNKRYSGKYVGKIFNVYLRQR